VCAHTLVHISSDNLHRTEIWRTSNLCCLLKPLFLIDDSIDGDDQENNVAAVMVF